MEDLLVDYVVGHLGTTLDTWFGNGVIWSNGLLRLAPALAAKFEDFVDWFQTEYSITDNASDVVIVSGDFSNQPVYYVGSSSDNMSTFNSSTPIWHSPTYGTSRLYCRYPSNTSVTAYVFAVNGYPIVVSDVRNAQFVLLLLDNNDVLSGYAPNINTNYSDSDSGLYYSSNIPIFSDVVLDVPSFSSFADGVNAVVGVMNGTYPDAITVDTGVISVPDTGGMTEDEELVIDVVYPGLNAMDWDLASQQIMTQALAGDLTATAAIEDAEVTEIVQTVDPLPNLLGINLPSFSFSLSGIWHYVRTWVSSLGSFMTSLFTVWNGLPYAMVVPVYATAVITIVVGLYRRFFM